ncbi:MAG: NifB/NifX family molybdenum-iron cluster-binding protein [Thermoplasmatota archaeon]
MRICIPSMGDRGMDEMVGEHFGRVPYYTIYDTDKEEVEVIDNSSMHTGGRGYAPDLISKNDVDIMLCGGLGRRAISLFEDEGIMVYVGARGTVRDALEMHRKGQLDQATDETACRQHAFRGEGTGEGHHH